MTTQPIAVTAWTPQRAASDDEVIGALGLRMRFAAGEEIYAQEEEADLVYRLIEGCVRTTRVSSDGRRQIGDFYYPGDFIGIEAGDEHRFSAEALSACEVLVIKRAALRHRGEEGARLERALWEAAMVELRRAQDHLLVLGRKGACERVASFLADAADRQPEEPATLAMGRQDMADYLGLTIETVSRMLTQLQAQGVVAFSGCRRFQILDRAALDHLCGG